MAASERLLLCSSLVSLLLISASDGATYLSYDIASDRVCNRFRKREVSVHMSTPVILESRAWTSGPPLLSCKYEVEGKGDGRVGVVGVVQRMKFRSQGDYCLDYIQAVYRDRKSGSGLKGMKKKDKTKKILKKVIKNTVIGKRRRRDLDNYNDDDRGPRVCGNVLFGLHVGDDDALPPPFISPLPPTAPVASSIADYFLQGVQNPYQTLVSDASDVSQDGELKTYLYVSNRPLRMDESASVSIAYSAFQVCDGRRVPGSLFHCGYGLCISSSLVNDGIVNCPFGDCIDETNCTNAKNSHITAHIVRYVPSATSSSSSSSGVSWGSVIGFLGIFAVIIGCAVYLYRRKRKQKKDAAYDDDEDADKPGEFVDPSKTDQQPAVGTYYPPAAPMGQPGYPPPPSSGAPGYYPMMPQQQQPGYPAPPAGQPGYPLPGGQPGYPQPGGQPGYPQPGGQPGYPQPGGQPGYPPPGDQPQYPPPGVQPGYPSPYPPAVTPQQGVPQAPGGIGFNMPPLPPEGYPQAPYPGAPAASGPSAPSAPAL